MSDMATEFEIWPISVDDYHRFGELGAIEESARVELFEGQLIEMPPIGSDHVEVHRHVTETLRDRFGDRLDIYGRISVPLGRFSEPQPDLAALRRGATKRGKAYPAVDDIAFLIEISKSSLRFDLGKKAELYARSGVLQYLVVDLAREIVVDHRDPQLRGYASRIELRRGESFEIAALPGERLGVDRFFEALD